MTPENDNPTGAQPAVQLQQHEERILDHDRLQLSALMDGALAPDQARFLLRRLQHDEELAGCWSRWQLCGDVMRGNASMIVAADFSKRVAGAIAAQGPAPAQRDPAGRRWLRWGSGAALAASVAVIALFMSRQVPEAQAPSRASPEVAVIPAQAPARPVPASPAAPDKATQLVAAVAVADVPRRAIRRSRGQGQRAAVRRTVRAPETQVATANAAAPAVGNPFAPGNVIQSRPWPRALLPGSHASGAFTVEYGNVSSFYPFAPRAPFAADTTTEPADATDDGGNNP
jgi:negative regulator of sigma E activity